MQKADLYWNLYVELRKEIIESQRIRAQVIGFKITFVSASIGLLASRFEQIPNTLMIIPAIASTFFDFLINSYSFSIKRIGYYLGQILEPNLKQEIKVQDDLTLWQNFSEAPQIGQKLALVGNFGITLLSTVAGIVALFFPFHLVLTPCLIGVIILLIVFDLLSFRTLKDSYFRKNEKT